MILRNLPGNQVSLTRKQTFNEQNIAYRKSILTSIINYYWKILNCSDTTRGLWS